MLFGAMLSIAYPGKPPGPPDGMYPELSSPRVRVVWGPNVGGESCCFIVTGDKLSGTRDELSGTSCQGRVVWDGFSGGE